MKYLIPISLLLFVCTICYSFSQIRTYPGVYVQEVPSGVRAVAQVETAIPAFIGYSQKASYRNKNVLGQPIEIGSFADYQQVYGGAASEYFLAESVELFFANGGKKCWIISVGLTSSKINKIALEKGLMVSKKLRDEAQLLLIPDAVQLDKADFYQLQNKMVRQCNELGSQFAILNTLEPTTNIQQDFQHFRSNTTAKKLSKSAVYYPWLVTQSGNTIPPSGAIAGVYAQVDLNRGVWKAPANVSLRGLNQLTATLTSQEQSYGNQSSDGKSINTLMKSTGKGILVWGSRTLAGNDNEWRYVPIRRLGIMIEQSIKRGLNWVVFEPNNEPLWDSAKQSVEDFLMELWRAGAFQGNKASDAFFVKCGLGETMTANDLAQKRMILQVGFAPLKPAEFVVLKWEWKMP